MRTGLPLALLTLAAACVGDKDSPPDSDDTAVDSTGSDSGDSRDSDSGTPEPDLSFDLSGSWEGSTLTLIQFDVANFGSDTWTFGDVLLSAPADATPLQLAAGEPPEGHLVEADPENAPGMLAAIYVAALHADEDGDGQHDAGEAWVGVSPDLVVYLSGAVSGELTAAGFIEGWNAMELPTGEGPPTRVDPLAVPLPASFAPVTELEIGGSVSGAVSGGERMALQPFVTFDGSEVDEILLDELLTDPWSMSVSGAPPADHVGILGDGSGPISEAALEIPVTYVDVDGSGDFNGGDQPLYAACNGDAAVALIWLEPPTELQTAFFLSSMGVGAGWAALQIGEAGGAPLTEAERTSLDFGTGCSL